MPYASKLRVALAVVLAALAYPALVLSQGIDRALGPAMFVLAVATFGCAVIGVPVLLALRRRGACSFRRVVLAGALAGLLLAAQIIFFGANAWFEMTKLFVASGALHAAAIWVLAVWRDPLFDARRF